MTRSTSEPREAPAESERRALASRIVRRMVWLGAAAAVPFAVTGDLAAVAILTLTLAVSIFHFRSLEAKVASLDARRGPPSLARALFLSLFRHLLLAAGLILILFVDVARPIALILGVSALPAALVAEALLQVLRARSAWRPSA